MPGKGGAGRKQARHGDEGKAGVWREGKVICELWMFLLDTEHNEIRRYTECGEG